MSVKKTRSLDNPFIFEEPKKSLKETPLRFLFMMRNFYEPKKNLKKTRKFDTEF